VQEHRTKWGTEWFVLPNAMYGSWARALEQRGGATGAAAMRAALRAAR
jgi:predicted secreted acid phosphatase